MPNYEHQKASLVSGRLPMLLSLSFIFFSIIMNSKSDMGCSSLLKWTANSHVVLLVNITDL